MRGGAAKNRRKPHPRFTCVRCGRRATARVVVPVQHATVPQAGKCKGGCRRGG